MGLLAGRLAVAEMTVRVPAAGASRQPRPVPLVHHITGGAEAKTFQPMNVNFGLFPPIDAKGGRRNRKDRYKAYTDRAKADWSGLAGLRGTDGAGTKNEPTLDRALADA